MNKIFIINRVIMWEILGFAFISLLVWLDEIIDIPYLLLGANKTPINWRESLFESVSIIILGSLIVRVTYNFLKKMKHLEGILPVCSYCKKIRDKHDNWHQIESYVRERTDAEFSHGICPECLTKYYSDLQQ